MRRATLPPFLSAALLATTAACSSHNPYSNTGAATAVFASPMPATSAWGPNQSSLPTGILASFNPPLQASPNSKPGPSDILTLTPSMKAWQDVQK